MPRFAPPTHVPAAARRIAPAAAQASPRRAGPPAGRVWQALQLQKRTAVAQPAAIQCKKVVPGDCAGFAKPTEGSQVPKKGTAIPMWSYVYKASAAKDDRAGAMELATDAYAKAGSAVDKPYLTRTELNKLGKPKNKGVTSYRNDSALPLVDPFVVTIATTYKKGNDTKTLELDAQFASQLSGYVIRVTDTGLGVDDTLADRNQYADTIGDERARPAKTSYSQYHHKTGQTALKDLLAPVEKTANPAVREKGVDAITKAVAEGGRFEAVKLMGADLADETIFYAEKDKKIRGISFNDLWLCWRRTFGKTYSISVSALKDRVVAGGIKKSAKVEQNSDPDMVKPDVVLPKGAHFDLVGGKKVVVAPPAPQPAPQPAPSNPAPQPSTSSAPSAPAPSNAKPATPAPSTSGPVLAPAPSNPQPAPVIVPPKTTLPVITELSQQPAPLSSTKKPSTLSAKAPAYTPTLTASKPKSSTTQLKAAQAPPPVPTPRATAGSGLPAPLKAGIEQLSGLAMDDVRVHRNSPEPARLGALAYARGSDIHLGPGQDTHLPHEAWHVVQQKEGRVRATLQAKGVAVNDDPMLEREADRMGAAACASSFAPASEGLAEAPAADGVVQGVLSFHGHAVHPLVDPSDPVPPALSALDVSAQTHHIRDDWEPANHGVIHILDGTRKYLLGETHGSGAWEDETRQWSLIPKMRESHKAFPGVPAKAKAKAKAKPGAAPKVPAKAKAKTLPLENAHAYFLHLTLGAHGILNEFRPNPAARPSAPRLDELIGFIDEMWNAALLNMTKEHDLDLEKPAHVALGDFILACNDIFIPKIRELLATAKKVREEVQKSIENKAGAVQNFTALVTGMIGEAKFIPELTRSLTGMLGIGAGSGLAASIAAEAASPAHVALGASVAKGVRDVEMALNIKAAQPPLLVQLGDLHVEAVAALVPGAVGLRKDRKLAKVTALDLGPKKAAPLKPGPAMPAAKPAAGPAAAAAAKPAATAK